MARQSKYRTEAIPLLNQLVASGRAGMLLTDYELFFLMNEHLGPDNRICYRTFQRYKKAALSYGEAEVEEQAAYDPLYELLHHTLIRNNIQQKDNLYTAMMDADGNKWVRYRWMMERKFPELNLRHQNEVFARELRWLDDEPEPQKALQPKEERQPTEEPEPQEEPAPFRMTIVDTEGNDWSDYAGQQARMNNARFSGVPLDEEPVPPPAPLVIPSIAQWKEEEEIEEEQTEDASEIHEEPEWDVEEVISDGAELPTITPTNPWLKPDGTMMTNEEYMRAAKERKFNMFPHRPQQPPPAPPKTYPPGTKKILGFA